MSLDSADFFNSATLASLRSLHRDRKLTIAAGIRPWTAAVPEDDSATSFVLCIDIANNQVLTGAPIDPEDGDEATVAMLVNAMLQPDRPAKPRLPRRVIVEEQTVAKVIELPLRRLGVEVTVAPAHALDAIVEAMSAEYATIPSWARDTATGLPIHLAAASLWAAAPWECLADAAGSATITFDDPVNTRLHAMAVESDQVTSVMFFLSDEAFVNIVADVAHDDEPDGPFGRAATGHGYDMLAVMFLDTSQVDEDDLPEDDIDTVAEMRWPVGSGTAYPHFVRSGDGPEVRQPTSDEARMLTLGMEALARFCLSQRPRLEHYEDDPIEADVLVRDGDQLVVATVVTPATL